MNFLERMLAEKRAEVAKAKMALPLSAIKEQSSSVKVERSFLGVLRAAPFSLIAEVKKASPSKGILVKEFHPDELAEEFEQGGATALSVLTDASFFLGAKEFVRLAKRRTKLPALRKDFIIDEYQIYESLVLGADAILLIVRILSARQLENFSFLASSLGLDVLVEAHSEAEVEAANAIQANIIGVNNRDLETFEVSLDHSIALRPAIHPGAYTISESGIQSADDIARLRKAGFHGVLVGEGVAARPDRIAAIHELIRTG